MNGMALCVAPVPPRDAQRVSNHPQRAVVRRYWVSGGCGGVAAKTGGGSRGLAPGVGAYLKLTHAADLPAPPHYSETA